MLSSPPTSGVDELVQLFNRWPFFGERADMQDLRAPAFRKWRAPMSGAIIPIHASNRSAAEPVAAKAAGRGCSSTSEILRIGLVIGALHFRDVRALKRRPIVEPRGETAHHRPFPFERLVIWTLHSLRSEKSHLEEVGYFAL